MRQSEGRLQVVVEQLCAWRVRGQLFERFRKQARGVGQYINSNGRMQIENQSIEHQPTTLIVMSWTHA